MRAFKFLINVCLTTVASLPVAMAQTVENLPSHSAPAAATSATVVPMLVRYDGILASGNGTAAPAGAGITFLIYKDEKGGDPLWIETQNVALDSAGRYEVYLGSTYSSGLPANLFGTGEARWLEVQVAGETPGPRTLLTSVPYALKAADAATLDGLPASAFALAGSASTTAAMKADGITADLSADVTTTGGANFYLPRFNAPATVIDSEIYDTGTSVGIGNIPNPGARLDVNGPMIMRGNMTVSRTGNATASAAYPSYGFDFFSNVYNSSTKAVDNPYFQLQSEPTGNDTASPSATFNLLFANNGSAVAETGLSINPTGTINFARGQTFPNTGTITGITTTSPLTGSGTSGSVALALNTTALENTLNGTYAQLGAANAFSVYQNFNALLFANAGILTPAVQVSGGTNAFGTYSLDVSSTNANTAQLGMVSAGTDAAIAVNNTASGGREYWIDSGSGSAGVGAGNFGIFDKTAETTRMVVDQNGVVGIGTTNPESGQYPDAQLVVDATSSAQSVGLNGIFGLGTSANFAGLGGTIGVIGYGGNTGGGKNLIAGDGGYFIGGNADTGPDSGYGLFAEGGYGPSDIFQDAAAFDGNIQVNGNEISNVATTQIDHPSDPANKYLNHASVQSSELMNLYTGNVTTDAAGHAAVKLPEWFEAENADFRYQLTVIGQFAQAIVKDKIAGGAFTIMTSLPNVEVSWQVTAIRQDAYARAHPLVVEQAKPTREVGFYKHPELFGQPANKQTEWGRNPVMMQRMEAQRAAATARKQQPALPAKSKPDNPRPALSSALTEPSSH